jgi:putative ABC transport system permease protein
MSGRDWIVALTLCRRELRGGLRGFGVFLGCLFLGVLAISAVGSLGRSLEAGLAADAKAILGGDVSVSLTSRDLSADEAAYLRSFGDLARTLSTRTMARGGGKSVLVELKGVDAVYPLYGRMELEGGEDLQALLAPRDGLAGAVADRDLLARLGLAVGDVVDVGEARLAVRGVIVREPDRVMEYFSLGPRLMVGAEAFLATGLGDAGSLFRVEYLLRLPGDDATRAAEAIRAAYPDSGWRVRDFSRAAPRVSTILERLRVDLTLVGLGALLVGGLGIAGGVRGYLGGRLTHMAAMKCMGAPSRVLFASYLIQVLFLGAVGACAGMAGGSLVPLLGGRFFADILPIHVRSGLYAAPLVQAALFGLVTTLAFSMPPLFRAVMVSPSGIFRGYISADMARMPRAAVLPTAAAFAVLAAMVFQFAGNTKLAAWFVGGTIGAYLLFRLLARAIRWLAGRAPRLPWASWRIGVANIHRPGSPGVSLVFALGFGLTALVAVVMVNVSLTRALTAELAQEAPAFFFMDIRPDQVGDFRALVENSPGVTRLDLRPMIRGRIVRIDGTPVENATVAEEVSWAVRGDRGLSYSEEFPAGSTLLRGNGGARATTGYPDLGPGRGLRRGRGRHPDGQRPGPQHHRHHIEHPSGGLADPGHAVRHHLLPRDPGQGPPDLARSGLRPRRRGRPLRPGHGRLPRGGRGDHPRGPGQRGHAHDPHGAHLPGHGRRGPAGGLSGPGRGLGSLILGTVTAWGVVQGLLKMQFTPDLLTGLLTVLAGVAISLAMGLLGTWRVLGRKAAPFLRNE